MLHRFFGVPGARVWSHSADHLPDAFMSNIHQVLMCSAATAAGFGGKSESTACGLHARVSHLSPPGLDQMNPRAAHVLTLPIDIPSSFMHLSQAYRATSTSPWSPS